ncbi:MAG: ABC transporter ATP-binding protein [Thermodesulfobacteriota bacterium]
MSSIISLEGVWFRYPGKEIFANFNFNLEKGEILGLIGPNSSGKTTLLKIMDGLLPPQKGRVLLNGQDLRSFSRTQVARHIAVVPQEVDLPFSFTVAEIVLMGRAPYLKRLGWEKADDFRIAQEAMALTDVAGLENRFFWELSQGEKQRVLIARALAQEAEAILMDEPTSHLDLNHQIEVNELMQRLNFEKKITVLHISHDLNLAAEFSTRLALLHQGTVFAMGRAEEVLTEENIRRVYEMEVVIEKNPFSGVPRVMPIGSGLRSRPLERKTIHLICGEGSGANSARRLLLRGYRVSLGVINIGDTDQKIGQILNLPMALEEPFSPISARAFQENQNLLSQADLIVVERFHIGPGNLANLQLALEALRKKKPVIVLENKLDFDFTGGEAAKYYSHLKEEGAIFIPNHSRMLEEIENIFKREEMQKELKICQKGRQIDAAN